MGTHSQPIETMGDTMDVSGLGCAPRINAAINRIVASTDFAMVKEGFVHAYQKRTKLTGSLMEAFKFCWRWVKENLKWYDYVTCGIFLILLCVGVASFFVGGNWVGVGAVTAAAVTAAAGLLPKLWPGLLKTGEFPKEM